MAEEGGGTTSRNSTSCFASSQNSTSCDNVTSTNSTSTENGTSTNSTSSGILLLAQILQLHTGNSFFHWHRD